MFHRFGPWTDPAVLGLDDAAITAAWAWEATFLDDEVKGVLFNEITVEGRFRRTRLRLDRAAIALAGPQLGEEVTEMLDPTLPVYPTPGDHCPRGQFLPPCQAMQNGGDGEEILARDFRRRPPEVREEGELGAGSGMGRGVVPLNFGERRPRPR